MATAQQQRQFHVIIERGEDGYYIASAVELPGCHTQAKTLKELDRRIKEAIELYLETNRRENHLSEFITVKKVRV
jgi:predicted RNase H-like HicB family nuclease